MARTAAIRSQPPLVAMSKERYHKILIILLAVSQYIDAPVYCFWLALFQRKKK